MTTSSTKLRLAFSLMLSLLTVLVALVFIGEIADIYLSASSLATSSYAYTPDALREHLIAPFVFLFLWIGVAIAAYIIFEVYPTPKARTSSKDDSRTLARLRSRIPEHGSSDSFIAARNGIYDMRRVRTVVWSAAIAVCVAGAIYVLIYLLDPSHYHNSTDALHEDALNLVRHVISWTAASLIACFAAAGVETYAVRRQLDFAKTALKTGDRSTLPAPQISRPLSKKARLALLWTVRASVGVIATAFIIAGVFNGGADSVLVKAINICTECIGLG